MPWCAECDRYLAPPSVDADGRCPTCHRPVDVAVRDAKAGADELGPVPWHFKAFLAVFALYLGFRSFQLIELFF